MEKLRVTVDQYSRWKILDLYIDRMEAHLESDFSHSVENAKALLETIGKEICKFKQIDLASTVSINAVLKKAFSAIGYSGNDLVTSISGSLANIGQQVGNLRNEISPISHGKSLDELRERNNKVDLLTREFLMDSTVVVAVFLIRSFEERESGIVSDTPAVSEEVQRYCDDDLFNSFWDDSFGEFEMGEYSYTASEILFNVDYQAYLAEHKVYRVSKEFDMEGDV